MAWRKVTMFGPYPGDGTDWDVYSAPTGAALPVATARVTWVSFANGSGTSQRCVIGVHGGTGDQGPVIDIMVPPYSSTSMFVSLALGTSRELYMNCPSTVHAQISGEELV